MSASFVVVNQNMHLNLSSQIWLLLNHLVFIGEFRTITYDKTTPNGKIAAFVSIATTSFI
jgi:hypothetical protein